MAVAPISLIRFSQRPPTLHTAGGANPTPSKKRQSTLLQRRSKRPGCPSESADQVPSMNRTSYTQIFNNKRICKPYNCSPFTTGFHEATDSTAVTSSGWKVESLLTQLGSANHRQMGDRDSQRFSNSFCGPPSTGMRAKCPIYSLELHLLIQEEVKALLGKGAVQVCNPVPQESFYSTLFLVAKKGGQMRPVINLKRINEWVTPQHFKMEGMSTLRELLKTNDWMAKIDLKDAYFTILMHPTHQPFLRFMANQQHFLIYQFTCLPFGLSCAPWVFTKVMKPISICLRSMGVGMIVYIDDILVMGESPEQVKGHLEALTYLLTGLGFVINVPKSITTPAQRIKYLGLLVDSTTLHLSLPGEKLHHIRSEIDQITKKSSPITARQLAQIIGKLHTASQAVLLAPLFYRSLQGDLQIALNSSNQNYNSLLTLSQPAQEELAWWQDKLSHWNAKALLHRTETVTIRSDVSIQGRGAVCDGTRTGGPWSHAEQEMHIY